MDSTKELVEFTLMLGYKKILIRMLITWLDIKMKEIYRREKEKKKERKRGKCCDGERSVGMFLGLSRHPEANPGISHATRYNSQPPRGCMGRPSCVLRPDPSVGDPKDKKSCLIFSQRPHNSIYKYMYICIHRSYTHLIDIMEDCTRARSHAFVAAYNTRACIPYDAREIWGIFHPLKRDASVYRN